MAQIPPDCLNEIGLNEWERGWANRVTFKDLIQRQVNGQDPPSSIDTIQLVHIFEHQYAKDRREVLYLTGSGRVYAYGANAYGILGLGHMRVVTEGEPKEVTQLRHKNVIDIRSGGTHVAVLCSTGQVYAWYTDAMSSYLRPGPEPRIPTLVQFDVPTKVIKVSCGLKFTLVLTQEGQVFGWGSNSYGQLTFQYCDYYLPHPVIIDLGAGKKANDIATGVWTSYAMLDNGKVIAWGWNGSGEVGCGSSQAKIGQPVEVSSNGTQFISLHPGRYCCAALTAQREIYIWGQRMSHCDRVPVKVDLSPQISNVISSIKNWSFVCRRCDGRIYAIYGDNHYEELGKDEHQCTYEWHKYINFVDFGPQICGKVKVSPNRGETESWTDYSEIFESRSASDVEFDFSTQDTNEVLYGNKQVLRARSKIFEAWLSDRWISQTEPDPDNRLKVPVKYNSPNVYREFLHFLYTGRLRRDHQLNDAEEWIELYDLSHMHMIPELGQEVAQILCTSLNERNWFELASFAGLYSIDSVMTSVARYLITNARKIPAQWPPNLINNHDGKHLARVYEQLLLAVMDQLN